MFCSANWHDFSVIKHIKVEIGRRSANLNLIKLTFFMVYPHLKPRILLNSNGLSGKVFQLLRILKKLWPIISHFARHDLVSVLILPNFKLIRAITKMDTFWSDT